jgi:hypothetical protein
VRCFLSTLSKKIPEFLPKKFFTCVGTLSLFLLGKFFQKFKNGHLFLSIFQKARILCSKGCPL